MSKADEQKVTIEERIPIVADERVPPGMALLGYDKDGKLVYAKNIDQATDAPERRCIHCGAVVHEEDGWWLDENGDQVCEDSEGEFGPHEVEALDA